MKTLLFVLAVFAIATVCILNTVNSLNDPDFTSRGTILNSKDATPHQLKSEISSDDSNTNNFPLRP